MFEKLTQMMLTRLFVSARTNPVMMQGRGLEYVLFQYSLFPKVIVKMLTMIRDRVRQEGWIEVDRELTRNIGEELGTESDGMQHYHMLVEALSNECGILVPGTNASKATSTFISEMFALLSHENVFVSLGAVYAIETTASPELRVVIKLITMIRRLQGVKNPGNFGEMAKKFFEMHVCTWEPGHEEGLRTAAAPILTSPEVCAHFEQGFTVVLDTMETWWKELALEASRF